MAQAHAARAKKRAQSEFAGFVDFIREQGVVGLAVGFILGGAVSTLVAKIVSGIVMPLIGIIFDSSGLAKASTKVGGETIMWGSVVDALINFIIIAAVVYFGVKALRLDTLDKKKG